jgi:hypothetical protein
VDFSIFNKELAPLDKIIEYFENHCLLPQKIWKNHSIGLFTKQNEVICAVSTRIAFDSARKTEHSCDQGVRYQLDP